MHSSKEEIITDDSFQSSVATQADIAEIMDVVNLAYRGGKSSVAWKNENHLVQGPRIIKEDLEKYVQADGSIILLLRTTSGVLAGTVHVEKHGDEAHIGMLSVHPDYQNFGLGKRLLIIGAAYAREEFHCRVAKMFVFGGRQELLAWYTKMGYELTGETLPFFGPESGLTALVENAHFVVVAKNLHD